jgi:signal transduction histidine kinase
VGPPAAVPVAELVQESLRLLRERASSSGSAVEVDASLPAVFGDRARLVQVFQNLLDNAMKFGERRRVRVLARPPLDERVVLVVQDEGIGIDPRHRERVLDVFERLDPRGEGSGVGLAVVKRIVESHGGRVWLESEGTGKGTAVCVELPLAPVAKQEATPAAGRPSGSGSRGAGRRET